MPDSFTDQLDQLAPSVDLTASRAAFDRAIGRSPQQRSWLLPAAVVTLLIAGVVGLWAIGRSSTVEAPVALPDSTSESTRPDGPVAAGDGFEVVHVTQTETGFGLAALVTGPDQYQDWMNPAPDVAAIDFERNIVLIMTRPDNACPDTLTHFIVDTPSSGIPVWTPQFEELANACDDPLLSWLYIVTLDRTALGRATTIRIPADRTYGTSEQLIEFRAPDGSSTRGDLDQPVTLEATGVLVPIPEVDRPTLHNTLVGLVWVVRHRGDSVSVLPATIDAPVDEDSSGVTMLKQAIAASDVGEGFAAAGFEWDAFGRAVYGGRANDLTGYAGRIVGGQIEVLLSNATQIAGQADPSPERLDASFDLSRSAFGQPIDPGTFLTLSSSGPIWRYLDATLVVENGVGRICKLDGSTPVPPATCQPDQIVLDTLVTSDDPTITSWFFSPILAFQDPFRGFTHVIPLGGSASRPAFETAGQSNVTVLGTELVCRESVGLVITVDFELARPGAAEFVVMDGDTELGSATAAAGVDGPVGVGFALSDAPSPSARLLVSSGDSEQNVPLTDLSELDCASVGSAGFSEVAVERTDLTFGQVYTVGSESELATLWDDLQPGFDRPATIDFAESVALIVTIPGNPCPQRLDRLDIGDDNWLTPVFVHPDNQPICPDVLWSWAYVIAVDRTTLDGISGFRLAADHTYDYPTAEASLPPAAG